MLPPPWPALLARQPRVRDDPLLRWTAVALAIATVSRLDYVLWPDLWIGDILQLAAYGALLWGSLSEIDRYQRRAAQQAVFDECIGNSFTKCFYWWGHEITGKPCGCV